MDMVYVGSAIVTLLLLVAGALAARLWLSKPSSQHKEAPPAPAPEKAPQTKKKPKGKGPKKAKLADSKHPRLITTLKNHRNEVVHVEFSPCGSMLASASEDRTLLLYPTKELLNPAHPNRRVNIQGDIPGRFCFSADGKHLLMHMQLNKALQVFAVSTKGAELVKQIDGKAHHKQPINSVDFASSLKYLMSCSGTDTKINLWDLKGNVVHALTTNQMSNQMARFSPDGRLLAVASVSTELRLWEIVEDKTGQFLALEKCIHGASNGMHKRTVHCLDFTADSKKLVTGSEDGTWKLWNLDVNYKRDEDAKCLQTVPNGAPVQYLRVSPDGSKLATVSNDTTITLWDLASGSAFERIERAHGVRVTCVSWSHNSKILASAGEDARVHLWKACATE